MAVRMGKTLEAPHAAFLSIGRLHNLGKAELCQKKSLYSESRMKPSIAIILCLLVLGVDSQRWLEFIKEAGQGTRDMWRAYSDMREANWIGADKYFHARGNYDAARRGPGGVWAAEVLSDLRENIQSLIGRGHEDSMADQEANRWGRSGKDPNHYRPRGLPDKY
ncbi:serum amyloid A-5 protein-like isoform X6 [Arvicola amphibius]|uniref:serum amyloid A-5 protein-like isoform X6 n=1 Tax=Arvicola amphibius TaxID=1047088 RepID=UPI0018E30A08|nr:serum amyloid A-5 protein-like isoform X6 [Arvicola amphibius]